MSVHQFKEEKWNHKLVMKSIKIQMYHRLSDLNVTYLDEGLTDRLLELPDAERLFVSLT